MPRQINADNEGSRLMRYASLPTEVHLRLMPVRAALEKLEKYLNDAALAGYPRVRVIHGKGTGSLKGAVQQFLSKHPLIARHYPAAPGEGDGGVTIAELR